MNLTLLAPDTQEAILFLPRTDGRPAPVRERHVRPICAVLDWGMQRGGVGRDGWLRDSGMGDPTHGSADRQST